MDQTAKTETTTDTGPETKKSAVDTIVDTLTVHTAKGLVVAKDALETLARWLDARAKLVGDLATKLSASNPASAAEATPETRSA